MAIPHSRVRAPPRSLPDLHVWYASCRHVGAFSTPSDPLIIDYVDKHYGITAEDKESMILALRHRERVRRICLLVPVRNLQKVVAAIDKEFPALDYLNIGPPTGHNTILMTSQNIPSAASTPPHTQEHGLSYRVFMGYVCSRLSRALARLPIRLLSPHSLTPAFQHASDGGSWDHLSLPSY